MIQNLLLDDYCCFFEIKMKKEFYLCEAMAAKTLTAWDLRHTPETIPFEGEDEYKKFLRISQANLHSLLSLTNDDT